MTGLPRLATWLRALSLRVWTVIRLGVHLRSSGYSRCILCRLPRTLAPSLVGSCTRSRSRIPSRASHISSSHLSLPTLRLALPLPRTSPPSLALPLPLKCTQRFHFPLHPLFLLSPPLQEVRLLLQLCLFLLDLLQRPLVLRALSSRKLLLLRALYVSEGRCSLI